MKTFKEKGKLCVAQMGMTVPPLVMDFLVNSVVLTLEKQDNITATACSKAVETAEDPHNACMNLPLDETLESRAKACVDGLGINVVGVVYNHLVQCVVLSLKEQDRDTRHACAEAVIQSEDPSAICMAITAG